MLLTGLKNQSMCGSIVTSMRETLEAQGALIGSIRVARRRLEPDAGKITSHPCHTASFR